MHPLYFERILILMNIEINIEKKKYVKPELETVSFEDEDIITCSGNAGDDDDVTPPEKPPIDLPIIPFF